MNDELEFEETWEMEHQQTHSSDCECAICIEETIFKKRAKFWFLEGRRTLREKLEKEAEIIKYER